MIPAMDQDSQKTPVPVDYLEQVAYRDQLIEALADFDDDFRNIY